jgi:hypothetical protein
MGRYAHFQYILEMEWPEYIEFKSIAYKTYNDEKLYDIWFSGDRKKNFESFKNDLIEKLKLGQVDKIKNISSEERKRLDRLNI